MNRVRVRPTWIIIVLLTGLQFCLTGAVAVAVASTGVLRLASASLAEPGNVAPDFEIKDLEGKSYSLSQYQGERPVLLYFWATWCPHCVSSRPQIARLRENIPASELEILGVNVGAGDSPARVKRFLKGHPVSWPILYDENEQVTGLYRVEGIPLYVLVNEKGEIVYRGHELPDLKEYLR